MASKLQLFSVRDSKAMVFSQPFFQPSVPAAVRAFGASVNSGDGGLSQFPDDYSLYHLGEFDDESGVLIPLKEPHFLGLAAQFKVPSPQLSLMSKEG